MVREFTPDFSLYCSSEVENNHTDEEDIQDIADGVAAWNRLCISHKLGCALFIGLTLACSCMLYFEPQTSKCTMAKHKFEKEMSAGQAVGKVEEDKLKELRKIKEYVILEKRFIALHTYSTLANLISLVVQAIHLWYLSCHLNVVLNNDTV